MIRDRQGHIVKELEGQNKLLKKYKTISKMKEASLEDLEEILPIEIAKNFKKYLNNN